MKKRVVIFGAGKAGIAALKNLEYDYNVVAFCDNDTNKIGTEISNLAVYSPAYLSVQQYDLILVASEFAEQITTQLVAEHCIPPEKVKPLPAQSIKSFHFGDDQGNRSIAEEILFALCDVLTSLEIKYHIDAGTLLGIYRDGELIPWDDDLDFAIPSSEIAKVKEKEAQIIDALEHLTKDKWVLTELFSEQSFGLVEKGVTRSFKLASENQDSAVPMIDFFIKYISGTQMDYVISSRGISMSGEHMNNLQAHLFKGKSLIIPSQVEGYLSAHYGDWETPKPDWTLSEIRSATVF